MAHWITIVTSFQIFDKTLEKIEIIQFWVIDISTAVYVQNQNRWWEIFKFQIVPIEKHASVSSWRLEALSWDILKNYM